MNDDHAGAKQRKGFCRQRLAVRLISLFGMGWIVCAGSPNAQKKKRGELALREPLR